MSVALSRLIEACLPAGSLGGVLARITLLLIVAWLLHGLLARANPRWRVLVWRVAAVGSVLLPLWAMRGPALSLAVLAPERIDSQRVILRPAPVETRPTTAMPPMSVEIAPIPVAEAAAPRAAGIPATPISAATPPSSEVNWLLLAGALYALGLVLGLLREVVAHWQLRGILQRATPVSDRIDAASRKIAAQLGYRRSLAVRQTREVNSPCVLAPGGQ